MHVAHNIPFLVNAGSADPHQASGFRVHESFLNLNYTPHMFITGLET